MGLVRVIVLGASAALVSAEADNTYLAVQGLGPPLLIDCGGSPHHKLLRAGIDPQDLAGVLLTHDHADHVYGLPALVQHLRMAGREKPLLLYGLESTLETVRALLAAVRSLSDFVHFRPLPTEAGFPAIEMDGGTLYTAPVRHSRPTLGVRIEIDGHALVYSCDTEPCPTLDQLARNADVLIHECTVNAPARGHSTPEDAARTAATAGASRLVLIHYSPWMLRRFDEVRLRIAKLYDGPVSLARYGDVYTVGRGVSVT
jgi:ribonuclease Z